MGRIRADQRGHIAPGLFDHAAKPAPLAMHGRRVALDGERGKHRVARGIEKRRTGVMVEIDALD
jgi:hypothetical protein